MANKLTPKISAPGSSKFPTKGPHNPNVGTSGSGIAPRNASAGQRTDKLSMPEQGGLARVQGTGSSSSGPSGPSGSFMPVQNNAMANLRGTKTPYGSNGTPPAARGGPPGIRAGGRNQTWPNGAMYTDAIKSGSSGKDSGPIATRKPKRRGLGANFYGE